MAASMDEIDTSQLRKAGASGPIGDTVPQPHEAQSPVLVGGVPEDTSDFAKFEKGRMKESGKDGSMIGSDYDVAAQVAQIPDSAYKTAQEREREQQEAASRGERTPEQAEAQQLRQQQETQEDATGAEGAPAEEAQAETAATTSRQSQEAAPGETAAGDGKAEKPGENQQAQFDRQLKRRLNRERRKHSAEMQAMEQRLRELESRVASSQPAPESPAQTEQVVEGDTSPEGRPVAQDADHYQELLGDMPHPERGDYDSEQKWAEDSDAWDQGKPLVHNVKANPIPPQEAAQAPREQQAKEASPQAQPRAQAAVSSEQQYLSDIEELIIEGTEGGHADDNLLEDLKERMMGGKIVWTDAMLRTIADETAERASKIVTALVKRPVLSSQISRKTEADQVRQLSELAGAPTGVQSKASPPKRDPAPDQSSLHGTNRPRDDSYESSDDFAAFERRRQKENGATSPIGVSF